MAWHLAPSLVQLRREIDSRWPNRDRTSDGTIGDAAHSATSSDHNPNSRDSVNAVDIDKDGVSIPAIKAAAERHPSVHYWIFNRQIADRDNGFKPVYYDGPNPHDHHIHISIRQAAWAENDTRSWGLAMLDSDDKAYLVSLVETRLNQLVPGLVTAAVRALIAEIKTEVRAELLSRPVWSGEGAPTLGVIQQRVYNATFGGGLVAPIVAALGPTVLGDDVDENAIAEQVLQGLLPTLNAEAIAAAIPPTIAQQVMDELSNRLQN